LLPKYNAVQNVCLPLLYQGYTQSQAQSKAKSILDKVGMSSKYFSKPNELSGGQQQRVAIARALVASAKIILADEPTGSLDSKTGDGIISLLKDLNEEGKTIILVTHDNSIANNCPRVIKLNDGRVV
jgi:putative ABC transport system ATP-binding protein